MTQWSWDDLVICTSNGWVKLKESAPDRCGVGYSLFYFHSIRIIKIHDSYTISIDVQTHRIFKNRWMKKAYYTVFPLRERYSYTIFPQSIGFISGYFIIFFLKRYLTVRTKRRPARLTALSCLVSCGKKMYFCKASHNHFLPAEHCVSHNLTA